MGTEFVRGRVCQGPSLLGAEMSRNPGHKSTRFSAKQSDKRQKLTIGVFLIHQKAYAFTATS